jgi:glutathione S-transferase
VAVRDKLAGSKETGSPMIDLYTWGTPNGRKVSIMLEECGLAYRVHPVDIGKGEQFAPEFVAISPNSKIPAIVDPDGPDGKPMSMMESGAILVYLAGKTGRFLPQSVRGKYEARHEWHRVDLAEFPSVKRWFDTIARRPAVARGMVVPFLN